MKKIDDQISRPTKAGATKSQQRSLLIKNGHVIDPVNNIDEKMDILVQDGEIAKLSKDIKGGDSEIIDAKDKYVCPGFIDMHVHLREPGREDKETIESGTKAAARGGFTCVLCMPNTQPPIDNEGIVEYVYKQAREKGSVKVYCAACITKGRAGKELTEMEMLARAGAIALTDDGGSVADTQIMRRAMEYSSMCNLRIIAHSEDPSLSTGGQMNEGYTSTVLGLKGIPAAAEELMVYRDISLSKLTGVPIHITHISTKGTVELIRNAKKSGIKVTCDTTPHYIALTEESLKTYDTNFKVNPPLRSKEDVVSIIEGLKDGTIDAIATDHAPHTDYEKDSEFNDAPCGMIGLETAVGICLNELVQKGVINISTLVSKFTKGPREILRISNGAILEGRDADITILDLDKEWIVDKKKFQSKARNTPFDTWKLKGAATMTIVAGKVVHSEF